MQLKAAGYLSTYDLLLPPGIKGLRCRQPKGLHTKPSTVVFQIRGTSILKITEVGFGIIIKNLWGPFFAVFYYREVFPCLSDVLSDDIT